MNDVGVCAEDVCTPNSTASCQVTGGTGSMTCNNNGSGYGACTITSCDEGFTLQDGKCQKNSDYCDTQTACTREHGTGLYECKNHKMGACVLNACESGFELKTTSNNNSCNPINNGDVNGKGKQ
jgi:hypothetical protein